MSVENKVDTSMTVSNSTIDLSGFKEIDGNAVRLNELKKPIIGIYKGSEMAKYSPIFSIETELGIVEILGVKDLTRKMARVSVGDKVYIAFAGTKTRGDGYCQHLADVRVAEHS